MTTGYSNFVQADDEAAAIAKAMTALEAKGITPYEVPLYVEDLGEGEFEVVLRKRVSALPKTRIDEAGDPDAMDEILTGFGLRLVK